jgi:hypothetical protein
MAVTCVDLIGPDWLPGILVVTHGDDEDVDFDPQLSIDNPTGSQFKGHFEGDTTPPFDVECTPINTNKLRIGFLRTHNDGSTTRYDGKVIRLPSRRGSVGVVRGTFRRTTIHADRTNTVTVGDWETERPT